MEYNKIICNRKTRSFIIETQQNEVKDFLSPVYYSSNNVAANLRDNVGI